MRDIAIFSLLLSATLLAALYAIYLLKMQQSQSVRCAPCPIVGPHSVVSPSHPSSMQVVETRDRAVLNDTLYPPTARDNVDNTVRILREPRLHPARDSSDTYSLVGYLISRNDKEDVWKLLARQVNRHESDFYAESSNRKLDLKVPLTSDIAKSADGSSSRPFRDMYDLPDAVHLSHPMFDPSTVYDVVQLPRAKLASGYF